jgi:small subunit ribosomal protein S3
LQQLFLKVEQLKLEMELSIVFNRNFYLKLHNVFNLPLYFDFIQLIRNKIEATTPSLGTLEFMFYLSCKLKNTSIIASFLAQSLELENRHRRVLWSTINIVKFLRRQLFLFKSIRIYITGKLNGKMRRKTYGFKLGRLAVQQINTNLSYFKATSFTKFGTISVKVWMFF